MAAYLGGFLEQTLNKTVPGNYLHSLANAKPAPITITPSVAARAKSPIASESIKTMDDSAALLAGAGDQALQLDPLGRRGGGGAGRTTILGR